MIQIICIKFGTKYPAEYVNKLFRGISRNTTKEFLFTCYTENTIDIDPNLNCQPLPLDLGDWHNKIGLYNSKLYNNEDQIFYFDLDTVIVGNLDEILSYRGDFIILRDPYREKFFGSGLMSWKPLAVNHMYQNYVSEGTYQKLARGDQGWPELQYPTADIWQDLFPSKIISYKCNVIGSPRYSYPPGDLSTASIVYFHGKPRPHEVANLTWMKEHWK